MPVPSFSVMTLAEFTRQPLVRQMAVVLSTGTFVAQRLEPTCAVNLFHLPGCFLVEVYIHTERHRISRVRAFPDTASLAEYAATLYLPDGLAG